MKGEEQMLSSSSFTLVSSIILANVIIMFPMISKVAALIMIGSILITNAQMNPCAHWYNFKYKLSYWWRFHDNIFPFELSLSSSFFCSKIPREIWFSGSVTCGTGRLILRISTYNTSLHFVYLNIDGGSSRHPERSVYKTITYGYNIDIGHTCKSGFCS